MLRNEHRKNPRGLADLLLPYAIVDDGVLLQQDGSLHAGWSFRGPDMMSASASEMEALSARLNQVLRLGSGWMLCCDAIRTRAPGYPEAGAFPDLITQIVDDERREQFMAEGAHFESEYFLTLTYLPSAAAEERIKGFLFDGTPKSTASHIAAQVLDHFRSRVDVFENVFGSLFQTERLRCIPVTDELGFTENYDSLLRYIRRCITGDDHPFALPAIPCFLNDLLAGTDFCGGV